jgi:hypothetical protein
MAKIFVHSVDQVPSGEHWAILEDSSVHVPAVGVWAPGHGYAAHDEKFMSYVAFTNKAEFDSEMERAVRNRGSHGRRVKGIHVMESYVEKTVVSVQKAS